MEIDMSWAGGVSERAETCTVGKIPKQKLHREKSAFRRRREISDIHNWQEEGGHVCLC
jgi:hypothetical protein